eukprot:CAMPEP_0177796404 /NCGR_PEP_ID=MMETSP0491_2-20121128/26759_1 /TAXON_ID=63592 /ORGANISM="Tetraselmis chuii, Strain PLY429" /LENGTH=39 /DNA_ID= /DNA_START= /DNA_END= /DNA_ORIENTATION=
MYQLSTSDVTTWIVTPSPSAAARSVSSSPQVPFISISSQ